MTIALDASGGVTGDVPQPDADAKDRKRGVPALNSTRVGRNPAKVLPAPVGAIRSVERSSRAFASSAN